MNATFSSTTVGSGSIYIPPVELPPPLAASWDAVARTANQLWKHLSSSNTVNTKNAAACGMEKVLDAAELAVYAVRQTGAAVPDARAMRGYLLDHPDMTELVVSVCELARKELSADHRLSLEVDCDPESDAQDLTLYVRKANYDQGIMDRIDGIAAKYIDRLTGKTGWLTVTTDFRAPQE